MLLNCQLPFSGLWVAIKLSGVVHYSTDHNMAKRELLAETPRSQRRKLES